MVNVIVYTCIANNYDWLLSPVWNSSGAHYICFTDNPQLKAKGWEMRPLPTVSGLSNGTFANRYCKFFPWKILPEHDWSLYIDANIRLVSDPSPILADVEAAGAELAIPTHPQRSNIWQEAEACKRLGKISNSDLSRLDAQLARYQENGLPMDTGFTENNIIFRSGNSARLMPVMEQWWGEFKNGVQRDQLSLPYVLWSTGIPIYRLPFSARDSNPYFRIVPHRGTGNFRNYVQARRYHGATWEVAFQSLRIVRAIRRRVINIFSKFGAR